MNHSHQAVVKPLAGAVLAALLLASGAQAADVSVYGIIDQGVKYTRDGHENSFEMNSGQINGSRFGLRGKEEISSDLKVYFNVEAGFDADTGALGDEDRFFNRNSIVGLETRWGDFKIGRTAGLVSGNSGGIFAGRVSPFGITWQEAQSTQVLSGAVGSRVDNSITYASPRMAGFQVHLQASNGIDLDDSVRSSYKDRYAAAGVTYRAGGLRFVAAVDRMFTKNAQAPGTAGYRGDDWMTYNIGGSYDFGMVRIHAGYQYGDGVTRVGKISSSVKGAWSATNEKNTTGFDTHGFVLGANIDVAGGELKVATGYVKGERDWKRFCDDGSLSYTYDQEVEGYQFALGYLYPFSKRTDFYVAGAYVHGKDVTDSINYLSTGNVAAKDATKSHLKSFIAGIRHSF